MTFMVSFYHKTISKNLLIKIFSYGSISKCILTIDLFADTAAILISIVSNSYYGMPRGAKGQIHINLPPEHPTPSFETIEIKWPPICVVIVMWVACVTCAFSV